MSTAPAAPAVHVIVNDERRHVAAGASALDVVATLGMERRPVAVELNGRVVPRGELAAHVLRDGDRLEIVTLVGGG